MTTWQAKIYRMCTLSRWHTVPRNSFESNTC